MLFKRILYKAVSVSEKERSFWHAFIDELLSNYIGKDDILSHFVTAMDAGEYWGFEPDDLRGWPGQGLIVESEDEVIPRAIPAGASPHVPRRWAYAVAHASR